jgi:hypothetical protein
MIDEGEMPEVVADDMTAPEMDATAAPDPVETTPEHEQAEATKTFSQEELDAIVSKRLAREQRKWERAQAAKSAPLEPVAMAPAEIPPVDGYEDAQAYAEAVAEHRAQQLLAQRDAAKQQAAILEAYQAKEEEARDKYDDFEQVAYNPQLSVTEVMAQTIQASDMGPDIIYYLGQNPKEADRIAKLPPILQAKELGRVEARLADNPPVKVTSKAPAPISPVTARSTGSPSFDTTDPRSIKSMSTTEWIEAERLRQIKKLEAQRNR